MTGPLTRGSIVAAAALLLLASAAPVCAQQQPTSDEFLKLFVGAVGEYLDTDKAVRKSDRMDALVRDNKRHAAAAVSSLFSASVRRPADADTFLGIALYLGRAYARVFGDSELLEEVRDFNALDPAARAERLRGSAPPPGTPR